MLAGAATFTAQLPSANEQLSAQSESIVGTSKQQKFPRKVLFNSSVVSGHDPALDYYREKGFSQVKEEVG